MYVSVGSHRGVHGGREWGVLGVNFLFTHSWHMRGQFTPPIGLTEKLSKESYMTERVVCE